MQHAPPLTQLKRDFEKLLHHMKLQDSITFEDIQSVIFHETNSNGAMELFGAFMRFMTDAEEKDVRLLVDTIMHLWNTTPHKSLGEYSPHEVAAHKKKPKTSGVIISPFSSNKTTIVQLFAGLWSEKTQFIDMKGENYWGFDYSESYKTAQDAYWRMCDDDQFSPSVLRKGMAQLLEREPLLADAAINLGRIFLEEGQKKQAEKIYSATLDKLESLIPPEFKAGTHLVPWIIHENRPYLRLLLEYAFYIREYEGLAKSQPYFERVLVLNPNDNQGVRGILSTLYLKTNQEQKVVDLWKKYPDDMIKELALGYVLALYKTGKKEKAREHLIKNLPEYMQTISMILDPQPVELTDRITVGGKDEAYAYYLEQGSLWQATSGAVDLLTDLLTG